MRNGNTAGCLNVFVASFSRIVLLTFWLSRPVQFNVVFGGSWLLPCLGFLFLPFTTLVYVWLMTGSVGGIQGIDWLWLGLAVLCDLATMASAGYTNRDRIPAGYPGSSQTTSGGTAS